MVRSCDLVTDHVTFVDILALRADDIGRCGMFTYTMYFLHTHALVGSATHTWCQVIAFGMCLSAQFPNFYETCVSQILILASHSGPLDLKSFFFKWIEAKYNVERQRVVDKIVFNVNDIQSYSLTSRFPYRYKQNATQLIIHQICGCQPGPQYTYTGIVWTHVRKESGECSRTAVKTDYYIQMS